MSENQKRPLTICEALAEVGLTGRQAEATVDMALLTDEEREAVLRGLADFGTSERLAALDTLQAVIERGERDAQLLDGRDFDAARFEEAYGLLGLLRLKEVERTGEVPARPVAEEGDQ